MGHYEHRGANLRRNLCSLRLVNRQFHELVSPVLFQHVLISSATGITRLEQISKNPVLRRFVRRLELCITQQARNRFFPYEPSPDVKERDLISMSRLAIVIHTTLPRFSDLKVLKLDFDDIPYSFKQELDVLESPGCRFRKDTVTLFESLATAICRSHLNKLEELDMILPLAHDYGHFLHDDDDPEWCSKKAFFGHLKRLRVAYSKCAEDGQGLEFRREQPNREYDKYVQQLLPLASNAESLQVRGSDVLRLTPASMSQFHLKELQLDSVSVSGKVLAKLFAQSPDIQKVNIRGVFLEGDTWEEPLKVLSKSRIKMLWIETCAYHGDGESGQYAPEELRFAKTGNESFIASLRPEDHEALELVFKRIHQNMRQIKGDSYDEVAADLLRERQKDEISHKMRSMDDLVSRILARRMEVDDESFLEEQERQEQEDLIAAGYFD